MAFNFYSRRFSASLLAKTKKKTYRKQNKGRKKKTKQSQTMKENNITKASAFPHRQVKHKIKNNKKNNKSEQKQKEREERPARKPAH